MEHDGIQIKRVMLWAAPLTLQIAIKLNHCCRRGSALPHGRAANPGPTLGQSRPAQAEDKTMTQLTRGLPAAMAAGAMAVSIASPALAHERHDRGWEMDRREAVRRCTHAAERKATDYHYGRARVTEITRVRHKRGGYEVKGRIEVRSNHSGWNHRRYDRGKFTCRIRYGRITDIDFSGIRTLH